MRAFLCAVAVLGLSATIWAAKAPSHEMTFVPLNYQMFTLTEASGREQLFYRDGSGKSRVVSRENRKWFGIVTNGQASVRTKVSGKLRRYDFLHGHLINIIDGEKIINPPVAPAVTNAVAAFWPNGRYSDARESLFFKFSNRFTWFYANPNKAGCLFAELALLTLLMVFVRRNAVRIPGVLLTAALFVLILKTESRGSLLAFVVAAAIVFLFQLKHVSLKLKLSVMSLAAVAAIGGVCALGLGGRFTTLFDQGNVVRMSFFRQLPAMMACSPEGWGSPGCAAAAFGDWFQSRNGFLLVAGLVCGHVIKLVTYGWAMRFAYLALWLGALVCGFAQAWRGRSPFCLAMWTLFGLTAVFNATVCVWSLWILPLVALAFSMASLRAVRKRTLALAAVGVIVVAGGLTASVWFAGERAISGLEVRILGNAHRVHVRALHPRTWVWDDGFVLDGGFPGIRGKDIRSYYARNPKARGMILVDRFEELPTESKPKENPYGRLVLTGRTATQFLSDYKAGKVPLLPKEILFLSAPVHYRDIPPTLLSEVKVKMVVGEHLARALGDWKDRPKWVRVVKGCRLYIPNWIEEALSPFEI